MSRDISFDENAICDGCGRKGAFDFMGDFYCPECLEEADTEIDEDDNPDEGECPICHNPKSHTHSFGL